MLFVRSNWDETAKDWFAALDADPSPPTPVAAQVLSGDTNADGREDLLYPTMTPDGVQVRSFRQRADRTYQRIDPVTVPLTRTHVAQGGWRAVDLDCDRRADLVNLDRHLTVLLARGDHGWQVPPSNQGDVALPAGGRWSVGDVTGDQCDDLVRVGPRADRPRELAVAVISGQHWNDPDRAWLTWWWPSPAAAAAVAGTRDWQLVNIDRDNQADLVHVDSRTGQVHTLLRDPGGWAWIPYQVATSPTPPAEPGCSAQASDTIISTGGSDAGWAGVDVGGDGAGDLVRTRVQPDGSLLVETLLSHGDGHYSPRTSVLGAAVGGVLAGAGSHHWTPTDLDHDGRGDLLRVFSGDLGESSGGDATAIQAAVSNGDGCWTLLPTWQPDVTSTLPATWAWQIGDLDGRGHTSTRRLDATADRLTVTGFDSTAAQDLVATTTNGLGASTRVDYVPGTSMLDADTVTISDVVLHVRYTARDGGGQLRGVALQQIKDLIDSAQAVGSVRLFSMRHEFPTQWARFKSQTPDANQRYELAFTLRPEHYPFWSQGRLNNIARVDLFAESAADPAPATISIADRATKTDAGTQKDTLTKDGALNDLLVGKLTNVPLPAQPTGDVKLYFEDAELSDLWIAVTWSG